MCVCVYVCTYFKCVVLLHLGHITYIYAMLVRVLIVRERKSICVRVGSLDKRMRELLVIERAACRVSKELCTKGVPTECNSLILCISLSYMQVYMCMHTFHTKVFAYVCFFLNVRLNVSV